MDVLYIPQLDAIGTGGDGSGESGGTSARYRILRRVPEDGVVNLTDRAVTRIELSTADALRLVVPPLVKGAVRDFFARLVVTADEIPEVTFAAPSGETVSFEDADEDVFRLETGVNVFAFTETDEGAFFVTRKRIDIDVEVEFDPCEGELDRTKYAFKLGAAYSSLPKPTRVGYVFLGWFTEAGEGGVTVSATDRCKTGVARLYAHWELYVDPFAPAICPDGDLVFNSDSDIPWTIDGDAARSGAIGDNGSTSLTTTVQGAGVLSFRWRTSREESYDWLRLRVDGNEVASMSGGREWEDFSHTIDTQGSHTLEWLYTKDGSMSNGEDCGWVKDVDWTPAEG